MERAAQRSRRDRGAPKALLLDLDDTLLSNPMETFIPGYFAALGEFLAERVPPARLTEALMLGAAAMDRNDGAGPTNAEAFYPVFYGALGLSADDLEPWTERFYRQEFPKLRTLTRPRAAAPRIVEWALERGLQVAIATNPMFPRSAIQQRLDWAGVGVDRYPYALVTFMEESRATKANPAYFTAIAEALGLDPGDCLMVGDHWQWDVVHATEAGLRAYWIAEPEAERPSGAPELVGRGTLDDLLAAAAAGDLGA
jgi:FMN phosphatase YigB (HAD superfamily)